MSSSYVARADEIERFDHVELATAFRKAYAERCAQLVCPRNAEINDLVQRVESGAALFGKIVVTGQLGVLGSKGCDALCHALQGIACVHTVDVRRNRIGNDGVRAVARLLRASESLRALFLDENELSERGAAVLADALAANGALTILSLKDNPQLGDAACAALLRASELQRCRLVHLDLSNCGLTGDSWDDVARAVQNNATLRTLVLSHNRLGDKRIDGMVGALRCNSSLEALDASPHWLLAAELAGCGLAHRGGVVLQRALEDNVALVRLDVQFNSVGFNAVERIRTLLARNAARTRAGAGVAGAVASAASASSLPGAAGDAGGGGGPADMVSLGGSGRSARLWHSAADLGEGIGDDGVTGGVAGASAEGNDAGDRARALVASLADAQASGAVQATLPAVAQPSDFVERMNSMRQLNESLVSELASSLKHARAQRAAGGAAAGMHAAQHHQTTFASSALDTSVSSSVSAGTPRAPLSALAPAGAAGVANGDLSDSFALSLGESAAVSPAVHAYPRPTSRTGSAAVRTNTASSAAPTVTLSSLILQQQQQQQQHQARSAYQPSPPPPPPPRPVPSPDDRAESESPRAVPPPPPQPVAGRVDAQRVSSRSSRDGAALSPSIATPSLPIAPPPLPSAPSSVHAPFADVNVARATSASNSPESPPAAGAPGADLARLYDLVHDNRQLIDAADRVGDFRQRGTIRTIINAALAEVQRLSRSASDSEADYKSQVARLQRENDLLRAKVTEQEEHSTESGALLREMHAQCERARAQVSLMRQARDDAEQRVREVTEERDGLKRVRDHLESQCASLLERITEAHGVLERLQHKSAEQTAAALSSHAEMSARAGDLGDQLRLARAECDALRSALLAKDAEHNEALALCRDELDDVKVVFGEQQREIAHRNEHIAKLNLLVDDLRRELTAATTALQGQLADS